MTVPSFQFLLLALLVAAGAQLSGSSLWRRSILLAANLFFLASFSVDPVKLCPFAGFIITGYVVFALVRRGVSRWLFMTLVLTILVIFFWLKKYTLLPSATFLSFPYVTIGLSYVLFRVLHIIIDAREDYLGSLTPFSYINYVLNFTTLVSGPIQRYEDYEQVERPGRPKLDAVVLGTAIERIAIGFFKVMVVCMVLKHFHDNAIASLVADNELSQRIVSGLLVVSVYPIYLYFNFSGYTDAVIGAAALFGLTLPENFNRPFSATNFIDFWTRWHITLSSWLKSYVYTPLMMTLMRRFPTPAIAPFLGVFAFFVTFFLIGVWHGRTSVFVVYGILLGGGMSANKLFQIEMTRRLGRKAYRALCGNFLYSAFCRGLTFTWFSLSLLCFWSDWPQLASFVGDLGTTGIIFTVVGVFFFSTIILLVGETTRTWALTIRLNGSPFILSRYTRTIWNTALVVILATINIVLQTPAPEIVYKAF